MHDRPAKRASRGIKRCHCIILVGLKTTELAVDMPYRTRAAAALVWQADKMEGAKCHSMGLRP